MITACGGPRGRCQPEAGSTAQGSPVPSVNSNFPGLPAGENKGRLCLSPSILGGVRRERKVSPSGRVAWPPRVGTFHKVTFQGFLPLLGLGSQADPPELSGPCVCREERCENEGWNGHGAPVPGETVLCCGLRQRRQAAHSFPGRSPSLGGVPPPALRPAVSLRGRGARGSPGTLTPVLLSHFPFQKALCWDVLCILCEWCPLEVCRRVARAWR